MHSFEWIQAALGIIVGLSMTRIAVSVANCVIARRRIQFDWIPFAWAACIFVMLLQFSWTLVELNAVVSTWRFGVFLSLLLFVFSLFLGAALVLPNDESQARLSLTKWFDDHGRWSTAFVAMYALLAYAFNWVFWKSNPLSNPASAVIVILAIIAFFTRSRRTLSVVSILMLITCGAILGQMILSDP